MKVKILTSALLISIIFFSKHLQQWPTVKAKCQRDYGLGFFITFVTDFDPKEAARFCNYVNFIGMEDEEVSLTFHANNTIKRKYDDDPRLPEIHDGVLGDWKDHFSFITVKFAYPDYVKKPNPYRVGTVDSKSLKFKPLFNFGLEFTPDNFENFKYIVDNDSEEEILLKEQKLAEPLWEYMKLYDEFQKFLYQNCGHSCENQRDPLFKIEIESWNRMTLDDDKRKKLTEEQSEFIKKLDEISKSDEGGYFKTLFEKFKKNEMGPYFEILKKKQTNRILKETEIDIFNVI